MFFSIFFNNSEAGKEQCQGIIKPSYLYNIHLENFPPVCWNICLAPRMNIENAFEFIVSGHLEWLSRAAQVLSLLKSYQDPGHQFLQFSTQHQINHMFLVVTWLWYFPGYYFNPYLSFFFFFKHLYWSLIALQWCVSFCCITTWISYTYTYIPISPPSCVSLPPSLSHPSWWTQSTKRISLCHAAASH